MERGGGGPAHRQTEVAERRETRRPSERQREANRERTSLRQRLKGKWRDRTVGQKQGQAKMKPQQDRETEARERQMKKIKGGTG